MPRLNIRSTSIVITAVMSAVSAQAQNPPPKPFSKYLVYTAAGVYDANIPPKEGDLAVWFHRTIMGRTPAQVEEEQSRADEYFRNTFGLPFGSSVAFGFDPRNEYRAYFVSGENVPPEGWVVRDGGFMVTIGDDGSGGTTLHGTWGGDKGRWVPKGTTIVWGDYNIAATGPGDGSGSSSVNTRTPIIIHYESAEPIMPNPNQDGIFFQCRIRNGDFGEGLAQGLSVPHKLNDGRTVANIRNILTFPGLGLAAQ